MKELSIEEKAQRYDEALTKARNIVNSINVGLIGKDSFEAVFPELAESEDERMRKALIKLVKKAGEGYENVIDGVSIENAIAWLEKQGEQKHQYNSRPRYIGEEELLGEQNHTDKVEPKFKVGDKIRRKTPRRYDKDMQVSRIGSNYYLCNHLGKFSSESISFSEESNYELVEQKSTEWSERDKEEFQIAIDTLVEAGQHSSANWLKSLKDRVGCEAWNELRFLKILKELQDIANQEDGCLALENLQLRLSELTKEDR